MSEGDGLATDVCKREGPWITLAEMGGGSFPEGGLEDRKRADEILPLLGKNRGRMLL